MQKRGWESGSPRRAGEANRGASPENTAAAQLAGDAHGTTGKLALLLHFLGVALVLLPFLDAPTCLALFVHARDHPGVGAHGRRRRLPATRGPGRWHRRIHRRRHGWWRRRPHALRAQLPVRCTTLVILHCLRRAVLARLLLASPDGRHTHVLPSLRFAAREIITLARTLLVHIAAALCRCWIRGHWRPRWRHGLHRGRGRIRGSQWGRGGRRRSRRGHLRVWGVWRQGRVASLGVWRRRWVGRRRRLAGAASWRRRRLGWVVPWPEGALDRHEAQR